MATAKQEADWDRAATIAQAAWTAMGNKPIPMAKLNPYHKAPPAPDANSVANRRNIVEMANGYFGGEPTAWEVDPNYDQREKKSDEEANRQS